MPTLVVWTTSSGIEPEGALRTELLRQRLRPGERPIQHEDLAPALAQRMHGRARRAPGPEHDRPLPAHGNGPLEGCQDADPIGVRPDQAIADAEHGVEGTDRPRDGLELVDQLEHRLLVRNRDRELAHTAGAEFRDGRGQAIGRHVVDAVVRVEAERAIGGVVHRRRAGMTRRMQHDAALEGRSCRHARLRSRAAFRSCQTARRFSGVY
jgi:hypothetical protein